MSNPAAYLFGIDDLRVENYSQPTRPLKENEVRVKVGAVGICGSDVHYLKHMRCADFIVKEPMVIGHESAGTVIEVGPGVTNLTVGDRVAMEPGIACKCCHKCKGGGYNLCKDMQFFATPPVHGSLAKVVIHIADYCFPLPKSVSLEEGAMCEPLSVGIHACRRAQVGPGCLVSILGAGPIGLVTLLVAKSFGASNIAITDVSDERLKVAKELGATAVINVAGLDAHASSLAIQEALGGAPTVTLDCCGFESSMCTALEVTDSGGKVCLIGMGHNEMRLPITAAAAREVDIVGVFRYRNTYPLAIDLIASKKINVMPLITHRYNIIGDLFTKETVTEAFEVSARGRDAIKVMFNLE